MALGALKNLSAAQLLRRGDGALSIDSVRKKMLVFQKSTGHVTLARAGIKIEKLDAEYELRKDAFLSAFVRLLVAAVAFFGSSSSLAAALGALLPARACSRRTRSSR